MLALAILRAFIAVRRKGPVVQHETTSVPLVRAAPAYVFCCDNLA